MSKNRIHMKGVLWMRTCNRANNQTQWFPGFPGIRNQQYLQFFRGITQTMFVRVYNHVWKDKPSLFLCLCLLLK